ncbi:MAG TPA: hypothetical protein VFY36_05435 [Solirubrobacteraceae bacterium]|nr:hypothetical protein [Solirubrobacteraceae bacterium]
MSKRFGIFTPRNHGEYAEKYWRHGEREETMTQVEHEDIILCHKPLSKVDPEFEMYLAAEFLAAAGTLGGPGSRLGASREEALRFLRRRLTKAHIMAIGETLEDYDLSSPHPPYPFGSGWTEADRRQLRARSIASDEREGVLTEAQWLARRHHHWYYRLIDRLPSRYRVIYALSIARRWRWIRYAV